MRNFANAIGRMLCVLAMATLGACSSTGPAPTIELANAQRTEPASTSSASTSSAGAVSTTSEQLIAIDFVNALLQFDGMHPSERSLSVVTPVSAFGEELLFVLGQAGYQVRISDSAEVENFLDYSQTVKARESDGVHQTFLLSVNQIKLKRDYFFQAQGVTPSSNLFIKGGDSAKIVVNDDLFELPQQTANVRDTEVNNTNPLVSGNKAVIPHQPGVATEESVALAPVTTPKIQPLVNPSSSSSNRAEEIARAKRRKANVYDTGESKFASILEGFEDVSSTIVVFPNDSLNLGQTGKNVIYQFLRDYNQNTDVISVIGCSHGKTSIDNGNELLAIGRAKRVTEELKFAGLSSDKILDEGCWAPQHFDEVFPRRGVVLTLKRELTRG